MNSRTQARARCITIIYRLRLHADVLNSNFLSLCSSTSTSVGENSIVSTSVQAKKSSRRPAVLRLVRWGRLACSGLYVCLCGVGGW